MMKTKTLIILHSMNFSPKGLLAAGPGNIAHPENTIAWGTGIQLKKKKWTIGKQMQRKNSVDSEQMHE